MASKITFQQLVDEFSNATGRNKVFARKFIKDVFVSVQEGLRKDEHVNIKGLGIFKLQEVPERETLNPKTGRTNRIPAHNKIVYKPEKALREKVNARYADLEPEPLGPKGEKKPDEPEVTAQKSAEERKKVPEEDKSAVTPEAAEKPAETKKAAERPAAAADEKEKKKAPKVVFDEDEKAPPKKESDAAPPPPPNGKKKMPTFVIEEKKKKSAWRWILPLLLIILIFIILYIVPTKFESFEKMSLDRDAGADAVPPAEVTLAENTEADEDPDDVFKEAPKPESAGTEAAPKPPVSPPSPPPHKAPKADVYAEDERSFIHIIKEGNTLWGLAGYFYNRSALWPNIYRKNVENMRTPDLLITGQQLLIPELQGEPYNLTKVDSARISQGYYLAYRAYKKYDPGKADDYLRVARRFSTVRKKRLPTDYPE